MTFQNYSAKVILLNGGTMNTQRKTFMNEIKAKDVRKLTQPIEGYYHPMPRRTEVKKIMDSILWSVCIVGMLICLWLVW